MVDVALVTEAYQRWLKAESGRKNGWRVAREHGSAAGLITEIVDEVRGRRLSTVPIRRHLHTEPTNGKVRVIGVESVKQQVLDYVVVTAMQPFLDARLGHWQVAGIPGKGQAFAVRGVRKWVREGGYFAHVDVRKCYPSIRPEVVMGILGRQVRSEDVLYVCEHLLSTYDGGLDLGSYFSLCMANLVLSFAYHFVETLHKGRRGKAVKLVSHQLWYMDDAYLFAPDKRNLKMAVRKLSRYMRDELGLSLKGWKACRIGTPGELGCEPVDVAGFRVTATSVTVRKGIFRRLRRAFIRFGRRGGLRLARRCASYWGYLRHSDTRRFCERMQIGSAMRAVRSITSLAGSKEATCVPRPLPS